MAGGSAAELAAALLREGLASEWDWKCGGFGRPGTTNPAEFLGETLSVRWIGRERVQRIQRHFSLAVVLLRSFWEGDIGDEPADAYLCVYATPRWEEERRYYHAPSAAVHLRDALARLRDADPPLANFVYYALVDSLRRVAPVYDWSTAHEEHHRQFGASASLSLGAALELGLGRVHQGDPKRHVPEWLRSRKRLQPGQLDEVLRTCRDGWARKVGEAARALAESATAIRRDRINQFPGRILGNVAGLVEPAPVMVVALEEMDPTEGMAREYLRKRKALDARVRGPAKAIEVPVVAFRLRAAHPAGLRVAYDRFREVCHVLERASAVVDLLKKWERRTRRGPEPLQVEARPLVQVLATVG